MGGRAVEGTGLENRRARERLVGSNPTPSATFLFSKKSVFEKRKVLALHPNCQSKHPYSLMCPPNE